MTFESRGVSILALHDDGNMAILVKYGVRNWAFFTTNFCQNHHLQRNMRRKSIKMIKALGNGKPARS